MSLKHMIRHKTLSVSSTEGHDQAFDAEAALWQQKAEGLEKLATMVEDPTAPMKAEESLQHLTTALSALEKECIVCPLPEKWNL